MYNFHNHLIPEKRENWKSAYEIEIAALQHEKRRIQMLHGEADWATPQAQGATGQKAGFLSFFKTPLQMLSTLMG